MCARDLSEVKRWRRNFTGEDISSKGEEWQEVEDDLLLSSIYLNSHRLWIGHLMLKTLLLSWP